MIIIQHIKTSWTKYSRGAPNSTLRSQVPKVLKIEGMPEENSQIYIHYIKADETQNFSLNHQMLGMSNNEDDLTVHGGKIKHYDNIMFYQEAEGFRFYFQDRMPVIRGPNRTNQALFNLKEGQSGRFLVNYRFAGSMFAYGPISYHQDIYNIVNCIEYNSNFFIEYEPTYTIDKLENLF